MGWAGPWLARFRNCCLPQGIGHTSLLREASCMFRHEPTSDGYWKRAIKLVGMLLISFSLALPPGTHRAICFLLCHSPPCDSGQTANLTSRAPRFPRRSWDTALGELSEVQTKIDKTYAGSLALLVVAFDSPYHRLGISASFVAGQSRPWPFPRGVLASLECWRA
jgi:hypothetical protein